MGHYPGLDEAVGTHQPWTLRMDITQEGGKMESRMDFWDMALSREDIRLYVSGSGAMSEIEASEEHRQSARSSVFRQAG